MESATGIVSNRVEDVCSALGAMQLQTRREKRRDIGEFDDGAGTQTAITCELILCCLDVAEIIVAPGLWIWTGADTSDEQKRAEASQPQDEWQPPVACRRPGKQS